MSWSHTLLRPRAARPRLPLPASATLRGWYDFTDPATLFQDAAGTIPVASIGDPIGRVVNKRAGGEPLTAAYPSGRPTWQPLGDGRRGARFDGVDDTLEAGDAASWKFLHDGTGAALFFRFRLSGEFYGTFAHNTSGPIGMVLNVERTSTNAYAAALVNSGSYEVADPAWLAETPSGNDCFRSGSNLLAVAFRRDGTTNTAQLRTNGVLRATDAREIAEVVTDPGYPFTLLPWSTPNVTIAEVLVYETPTMFDQAEAVERYLAS